MDNKVITKLANLSVIRSNLLSMINDPRIPRPVFNKLSAFKNQIDGEIVQAISNIKDEQNAADAEVISNRLIEEKAKIAIKKGNGKAKPIVKAGGNIVNEDSEE